uniref:Phosphoinositide phospholipase C n=1 Tax=Meloidogyne hapla TaxID=6305 RepID=A0A1I8AZ41_MELHA
MNASDSNQSQQLQFKEKEKDENKPTEKERQNNQQQQPISVALPVRRVKQGKIGKDSIIVLDEYENTISYDPMLSSKIFFGCSKKEKKTVSLFELLEIRQGYRTDNWHRAVRTKRFQENAPEDHCFSIIFKHPRFVCKSLDFIAFDKNKALEWVEELRLLLNKENKSKKEEISFDENIWLLKNYKNADLDKNGKIGFNELWKLLKRLNLQLSELYVKALFKETLERSGQHQNQTLTQKEFLHLFSVLTDLPEYKNALRLANDEGNDWLDANSLLKFLKEEQEFKEIELKKAEAIIDFCEPGGQEIGRAKILTINVDIFDGENGEPQITHKHTFIAPISLRNVLNCIKQYAFIQSQYPVILTIENHVSPLQQKEMAEIFKQILGDHLYIPPLDASLHPLPSPNKLKNKFLLRGKTLQTINSTSPRNSKKISKNLEEKEENSKNNRGSSPPLPIDPNFGKLIALPSFKWICGIQLAAMNFQTCDEELDINKGLFSINGSIGYILKPKILLEGRDPRHKTTICCTLEIAIICGQYLPKAEPGKSGIVDPYVSVEIFGIPNDRCKLNTKPVYNNGFNPVWNENMSFSLRCPELAILRICVKDFDSTSADEFIGEFSVPVQSIRQGYSHVRLNTGSQHLTDEAASLFLRIAFS